MILSEDRILILDGAMGTMIQRLGLTEEDYHRGPFSECAKELKGNSECLNITCPEAIRSIHDEYIAAGADIIEANTFSANRISQAEYGCEHMAYEMAYQGARIAREAADKELKADETGPRRKVWVAGSMGPTSKSLSLSPDASDPSFRPYTFTEMQEAYLEQAEALIKGGADILLLETCFDALNVKAALSAIQKLNQEMHMNEPIPVMISVSVGDRSGRTLTGQTLEAFYTAVSHYPIISFGLNCSLGAAELTPLIEEIDRWCSCAVSCYPNAGLPNEMGGYDQSPEEMAAQVRNMAGKGLINIAGGCCGTTPEHIRAIAEALNGTRARKLQREDNRSLKASGLEAVAIDRKKNNFTNVGERTNVAGSRKFARLISEGKYEEGLQIAAKQIEDGATIIDINMDDAMLDSTCEMEKFVRYISNDPATAKAALMIDSSHWDTIMAGLQNAQGKCIVNSISLKEGEETFIKKAKAIRDLGAAMVVMAFDEEGQATTFSRKISICQRAYAILTEKAGIPPQDIIFDPNILSIGTGIEEHARYAVDYIEAVRWIKANLPGALTSGGLSNLSFSFRGNNAVREAMHSAFLYHAINAGMDMAILNPSMLQIYDEIEPELLKCVEDVIFDKDPQATERLLEKAGRMLQSKETRTIEFTETKESRSVEERLADSLIKGRSDSLEADIKEAMDIYSSAVAIIEGPLMKGMETVGEFFAQGKMFLPQVVKSAKVMRDAVTILEPFMENGGISSERPTVVIATVKGDVHDIGKNITSIVLTCNGFNVHDLGVMVNKETIIAEAERLNADIVAVSGLITPSLYQMEELCKAMTAKGMDLPLLVGGATTSALHTAVKLSPLYAHVFHGTDASAAAVMAKKLMMDREATEREQHEAQRRLRDLHMHKDVSSGNGSSPEGFSQETYCTDFPEDIPVMEVPASEVLPFFDWKMFYAIWGVKYGSAVPEAMELIQLRRDAEDELEMGNFRIRLSARFLRGYRKGDDIHFDDGEKERIMPFMRQEGGKRISLSDFVISEESGRKSPFGVFAISVHTATKTHEEGCSCPACSNRYEDLIGKTVRMTLAEAASAWLDKEIVRRIGETSSDFRIIKPAAGYASCPDHTLKGDILDMLGDLKIRLTESYAMTPEASICGFIFMHPQAVYPEIRHISKEQYDDYAIRRGMDGQAAERFLRHLL